MGSSHPGNSIVGRVTVDEGLITRVRLEVLAATASSGHVPDAATVAQSLEVPPGDVTEAFRRLADTHVYVAEPKDQSRLRMANPYSAIPTPFRVEVGRKSYFANCVWDALGVVSLLGGDGRVSTACPDCGQPLELRVTGRRLVPVDAVVHFSVPARHWWDDIIHT
jgi:hypothetical protein